MSSLDITLHETVQGSHPILHHAFDHEWPQHRPNQVRLDDHALRQSTAMIGWLELEPMSRRAERHLHGDLDEAFLLVFVICALEPTQPLELASEVRSPSRWARESAAR